jgi:heme-degrading monooxygenase HmoA
LKAALAPCRIVSTSTGKKEKRVFIAMNRFKVNPERGEEFEQRWRDRESYLESVGGFQQFLLLRGDEEGEYISHTTWASRDAFLAWAQSDSFRRAHDQAMPEGLIVGHPRASFYETVVLSQPGPR